jgi:hypothetical protein
LSGIYTFNKKHSGLYYAICIIKVTLVCKMIETAWCSSISQHKQTVLAQNISEGLLFIDNGG